MIFFKNNKKSSILFYLSVLCCLNASLPSVAAEKLSQEEESQKILKHLAFSDQETETAKRWENYLKERTWFNDEEHQTAILRQGVEFAGSITALNECNSEMEQKRKQYSSDWIKDFRKRFDRAYTTKNMDSIKFVISCINSRNNLKYCEERKKEALYREILYRDTLKDYMRHLQSFSQTLNTKERKKIDDRLTAAGTYLEGPPYPLQVLLSPGRQILFSMALKTRKDMDPQLVNFFTQHPFFQKPFDPMKAVKDLEAFATPKK